jgi:hypothetical protein
MDLGQPIITGCDGLVIVEQRFQLHTDGLTKTLFYFMRFHPSSCHCPEWVVTYNNVPDELFCSELLNFVPSMGPSSAVPLVMGEEEGKIIWPKLEGRISGPMGNVKLQFFIELERAGGQELYMYGKVQLV